MLAALPVVGTAWGGQADFLNNDSAFAVKFRLVPVEDEQGVYSALGGVWADADVTHAAELLRTLNGDRELGRRMGQKARMIVQREFGLAHYAEAVSRALGQAGSKS